jgi:glucose-6-phosphate dehydrogenase assembly protein OpcA
MQSAMTANLPPGPCPELGREVEVQAIDRELRKLWDEDEARTHASLMNLVVFSEEHGSLLRNSELVRDLTRSHACRAILVEVDRAAETPRLRSWVTVHCHLVQGHKSVCFEQISLYLAGRVTGRFRNTVFAHLNSDLPLVFWWQGELSDILSDRVTAVVDRLIVDSSAWRDPLTSYGRLLEAAEANRDLILQDQAWTRTWQFRVGVASVFDDPAACAALPAVTEVEATFHPQHRNSALMLVAWLAEQAGWQNSELPFRFVSAGGTRILVTLREDPAGPPLSSLALHAGAKAARIIRAVGSDRVERKVTAPGYRASSFSPADPDSPEELIATLLARGGRNTLFRKILPRFLKLLEICRDTGSQAPTP